MCFNFKPFFSQLKMSQELTKSVSHENLNEISEIPVKPGRTISCKSKSSNAILIFEKVILLLVLHKKNLWKNGKMEKLRFY